MGGNIINIPSAASKPTVTSCQQQYLFIFIPFSYYAICYISEEIPEPSAIKKGQHFLPTVYL